MKMGGYSTNAPRRWRFKRMCSGGCTAGAEEQVRDAQLRRTYINARRVGWTMQHAMRCAAGEPLRANAPRLALVCAMGMSGGSLRRQKCERTPYGQPAWWVTPLWTHSRGGARASSPPL